MRISFDEFYSQLTGAKLVDAHRWTRLNMEESLWQQFCFDDEGCRYIPGACRHLVENVGGNA